MASPADLEWRARGACDSSACVEMATTADYVFLRSSGDPTVHVRFTHEEWSAFLDGLDRD